MSAKKWESYGRICLASKFPRRKHPRQVVMVKVKFWLPNDEPPYLHGSYLRYETENHVYKIYNPLRIAFDVRYLLSYLQTFHAKVEEQVLSWEIVEE